MKRMLLLFVFTIAACGEGLKVSSQSSPSKGGEGGLDCKIQKVEVAKSPIKKVQWSTFIEGANEKNTKISVQNSRDIILKSGTEFVVLANNQCLYNRLEEGTFDNYPITKKINLRIANSNYSVEHSHVLRWATDVHLSFLEELAENDSCIVMIQRNIEHRTTNAVNDPRYPQQNHLLSMNFDSNYRFFSDSIKQDTIIAIIDNGVDINHEDLQGNLWINDLESRGQVGFDDDGNGYTDDIYGYDFATNVADPNHKYTNNDLGSSHGSHVAGLSAAVSDNSKGVAGVMGARSKIMSLNVFGNSNGANTSNIDNAIRYAADKGAHVINMSLGGRGQSPSTERAIQYAISKGALVVVAAGNDSQEITSTNFYTPAGYGATNDGMITIGATDSNLNRVGNLCSFSNRSTKYVELGAPGCESGKSGVLSLLRNNSYGLMQGTSMASPVAAGVSALVFSVIRDKYNKKLTPSQLERFLKDGSKNYSQINSSIQQGKVTELLALKNKILFDYENGGGGSSPCP